MPTGDEIQRYLFGAWRLMLGRADGLRLMDLSADGFWNSFFAIVVSVPALVVGWVGLALDIDPDPAHTSGRIGIVLRLAVVDFASWVVPLAALALVARPAGVADRFVHYVVATNWASALLIWLMLPLSILRLFVAGEILDILGLLLFVLNMALSWRVTTLAVGKGAPIGTAVFVAMFVASLLVLFGLQEMFGLSVA
ncbi:MAG: transporter [Rhizobiaceae bacterium]